MIKKVVIVGGGFAGWYTASSLQHNVRDLEILVIDSARHPTMGIGETLGFSAPLDFERLCGLKDDREFMYETGAIYKFGARAINFFSDCSVHQWGKFLNLKTSSLCNFYNEFDYNDLDEPRNRDDNDIGVIKAWLSLYGTKKNFKDFSLEVGEVDHFLSNPVAPFDRNNKYVLRNVHGQSFGYHIDAERSGWFLKELSKKRSQGELQHITSTVVDVELNAQGAIECFLLENGQKITGDLYIDASGFQRVLMSRSSNDSWTNKGSQYCNAAWVCHSNYTDPKKELMGATEFFGEDWGWRFKIRMFHRIGNGYIFNTNLVDPEIPLARLKELTDGHRLTEPRLIHWVPGEYLVHWHKNLIPLGMSSGLIDPWDAPTFDLQGRALEDLIYLLNNQAQETNLADEYNRRRNLTVKERDLRLHITFGLSKKSGPFWSSRRQLLSDMNGLQILKDIILEKRLDLESRMQWYWHHQYIRTALITGVDMQDWNFAKVPLQDIKMLETFFCYNKQRNEFISQQEWPSYSQWLQHNRFNGANSAEVLARINPGLCK